MISKEMATKFFILFISTLIISGSAGLSSDPPKTNHIISLQYGEFDTRYNEPVIPSELKLQFLEIKDDGYYIVQFEDSILPEWKAHLLDTGAELLGYVPHNAYIIRANNTQLDQIRDLLEVQWIGIFQPAYRIAPWINYQIQQKTTLVVLTFPGANNKFILEQIEAWGGEINSVSENEFRGKLVILIDSNFVTDIAKLSGIMWIEPWSEPTLTNDIARGIMDVQDTVWATQNLYGAGQIVAIADTGLDIGQNNSLMSDDFEGRVISTYCLGRTSPCNWSDPNGHGTHVAGSVLGNGRNSGSNPGNHNYSTSFAGIAPEADLVFQSLLGVDGSLSGIPDDLNDLFQQAYDQGARIHTNSWGQSQGPPWGEYSDRSFDVDQFLWNHPDMTIFFSAGNNGIDGNSDGIIDLDLVGWPGTAKNVITVGATENLRPSGGLNTQWGDNDIFGGRYPSNPIHDDWISNNYNGLAAFSSRGPVDGQRIKPDVVAPGTNILSTRSHAYSLVMDGESGQNNWSFDAPWQITDTLSQTGVYSMATGPYDDNVNAVLSSPTIDLRTGANTITFWTRYDFGNGDFGYVEYWNGVSWINCDFFSDTQDFWSLESCNMDLITDDQLQNIQIRFRLQSDSSLSGNGWYLDNILITPRGWGFHSNEDYLYMGGTSMSTPLVAGSAALIREFFQNHGHIPSAAMIKSLLVNGAVNISPGQYPTGSTRRSPNQLPNNVIGWGRVNVQGIDTSTRTTNSTLQRYYERRRLRNK